MSGISFGGLATGLPADLVDQLMQVERIPITRFEQRISTLRRADSAWSGIVTKTSSLRSAVNDLLLPTDWNELWKTSSSDEDAIAVSATGPSSATSLSVTVVQLAQRQSQSNASTWSGIDAALNGATLAINGTEVTSTDGTLGGLVAAVNSDAELGATARAVQVRPGEYQLQLTATGSGAAGAFTLSSTGFGDDSWSEVQQARDAILDVDGLRIMRSSNVVDDLVDGATLTLKAATTGPVTVGVTRDLEQTEERIKGFVSSLNDVLAQIKVQTQYSSGTSSPLTGDPTARRIASKLTDALLRAADVGGVTPAQIGITITREGSFTLDEAKLTAALEKDFASVQGLVTRATKSSDSALVTVGNVGGQTAQGTYTVDVVTAASKASLTGNGTDFTVVPETLTITTTGGDTVVVDLAGGMSVAAAVAALNDAIADGGVTTLSARVEGGRIVLEDARYGQYGFTVSSSGADAFGLAGSATGTDAVVRLDGQAFTGSGQDVRITSGAAAGLSLTVSGAAGTQASVTVDEGLTGRMAAVLDEIEGTGGAIARARGFIDGRISDLSERIEAFERRLTIREVGLRRQFSALESMIGQLNSQGQWLSSQLSSLPGS